MHPELKLAIDNIEGKLKEVDKIAECYTMVTEDRDTIKGHKDHLEKLEAELEHLPTKIRADFQGYLDQFQGAQHPNGPVEEWRDMSKMSVDEFGIDGQPKTIDPRPNVAFRKTFLSPWEIIEQERRKTIAGTTTDIAGARIGNPAFWHQALVGDPWPAAGARQFNATGTFKVPEISAIAFTEATAVATTTAAAQSIGAVTENEKNLKRYSMLVTIPWEQEEDAVGTISHIEQMIREAYGTMRGALSTAAVAGAAVDARSVASGTAKTGLTKTTAIEKLLELTTMGNLPKYYAMMPAFMLNPADASALFINMLASGGLAIDPNIGVQMLGSWPIYIDPQAEGVGTDANHPDAFGAWRCALLQAQRGRLYIERYMATTPGAITLFASFRFLAVSLDANAQAQIKVGASL